MRGKEGETVDFDALLAEYERNHQSAICKATHAVGIPLIALSLPLLLIRPRRGLLAFAAGWALQFAGHAAEGKPPKFFEGKEYFLAGLIWWLRLVRGALRPA